MAVDHHLAEFNFGTLRHDWDDPRIADFQNNLDRVNGLAARSPGFVWRLDDAAMETAQLDANGVFDNPRTASTLSVWEDFDSLWNFVWKTVHRRFYDRRAEWYDAKGNGNFVMWWVPVGHRPDVAEGMARFEQLQTHGSSDFAFGWKHLRPEDT